MIENSFSEDLGKFILRLTVGALVLLHGITTLLQPEAIDLLAADLAGLGFPEWLAHRVYLGEVIAPLMIILGFYARLGGLLLTLCIAVKLWLNFTGSTLLGSIESGGLFLELQVLYLFGALAIALLGSGRFAIRKPDRARGSGSALSTKAISSYG